VGSFFEVRPATSADVPAIARVFRASFRAALPHIPDLHTPEEDVRYFGDVVLPSNAVLVAEDRGGEILGLIAFTSDWVNHLYIAPQARRSGIGSQLIGRAKEGTSFLQLWTFQANTAARAFYRHHGFVEVELTDGAGNEEKEPDVRLEWRS